MRPRLGCGALQRDVERHGLLLVCPPLLDIHTYVILTRRPPQAAPSTSTSA
jgi:hypothetical protein